MTVNMWIATVAWLLLVIGYNFRRKTTLHVPLVLSGISLDILLVIYLQLTRSAIQKALAFDLAILRQIHIAFSTSALLLYIPVLFLGFKLLKTDPLDPTKTSLKNWHIKIASCALILRTLGFIFMFSMLKQA